MIRRGIVVAMVVFAWLLLNTAPASAHTDLVSSSPAASEVLTRLPGTVELVFNEDIAPEFVTVTLTRAGDTTQLEPRADGATVTAPVPAIELAGSPQGAAWTLAYRVVSTDGHPITGQIPFRVTESASGPDAGPQSAQPDTSDANSSQGLSVLIIGLFTAVTTVAAMYFLARGRTRDRNE